MKPTHGIRRGFTLIETVAASGVSAVLLLSLGSVVMIASRAVPSAAEPLIVNHRFDRALAMLRADISEAIEVYADAENLILAVPDRDNDGDPEAVHYSIDASRMLARAVNGGPPHALAGPIKGIEYDVHAPDGRVLLIRVTVESEYATPPQQTITVRLLNTPEVR